MSSASNPRDAKSDANPPSFLMASDPARGSADANVGNEGSKSKSLNPASLTHNRKFCGGEEKATMSPRYRQTNGHLDSVVSEQRSPSHAHWPRTKQNRKRTEIASIESIDKKRKFT